MKIFTGVVISNKMKDTAVVAVTRLVAHPVYKKRVKKTKKYLVHDIYGHEVGQAVQFVAGRPVSKLKKWKIYKEQEKKAQPSVKTSQRPATKKVSKTSKQTQKAKKPAKTKKSK